MGLELGLGLRVIVASCACLGVCVARGGATLKPRCMHSHVHTCIYTHSHFYEDSIQHCSACIW